MSKSIQAKNAILWENEAVVTDWEQFVYNAVRSRLIYIYIDMFNINGTKRLQSLRIHVIHFIAYIIKKIVHLIYLILIFFCVANVILSYI